MRKMFVLVSFIIIMVAAIFQINGSNSKFVGADIFFLLLLFFYRWRFRAANSRGLGAETWGVHQFLSLTSL